MTKRKFTERDVYLPSQRRVVTLTRGLVAGEFLAPWAEMDPDVVELNWDGVVLKYPVDGIERSAHLPLKVRKTDGSSEWWDVVDGRTGVAMGAAAKLEHARCDGCGYRLFDREFLAQNVVELRNRQAAFFLLANARCFDLVPVRTEVLTMLGSEQRLSLKELGLRLSGRPMSHVRAAVFGLWRERRVRLPMSEQLLGPDSVVTKRST